MLYSASGRSRHGASCLAVHGALSCFALLQAAKDTGTEENKYVKVQYVVWYGAADASPDCPDQPEGTKQQKLA